ncbi:hypothetical protein SAMN05519104_6187 [Rhizobiales bacterium GAS188]|nr:hypothetical protein SAMN05519104_6187 [Rhizobiales bacterium GAS188]
MTADVSQGQTCDRASPGAGAIQCRLADGSRLFWASPSPVYERLGHRAIAPDRIQGDAVLPHISHTAQSRITFRRSQAANIQPQRRPQPPDSWRSIGSGIPPPVPKTPLDKPPLIQGEGGERSEPGGVRIRRSPPPVRSARASRPPSPARCASRRRDERTRLTLNDSRYYRIVILISFHLFQGQTLFHCALLSRGARPCFRATQYPAAAPAGRRSSLAP